MSNIMKLPGLKNNVSREGYDLSFRNAFTAKTGEILPIGNIPIVPGDKMEIDISSFTRTLPVETAAFTRIKEYIDAFYVPYDLLWNKFNTFITQMEDNQQYASSITTSVSPFKKVPYTTTKDLYEYIQRISKTTAPGGEATKDNQFGYTRGFLTSKLLEYLNLGDYSEAMKKDWSTNTRFSEQIQLFPLLAYQKIYQDHFRFSQWEKYDASSCNVDWIDTDSKTYVNVNNDTLMKKHNNLLDMRYCNFERDYFFGVLPQSQYGAEAVVTMGQGNYPDVIFNNYLQKADSKPITNDSQVHIKTDPSTGAPNFIGALIDNVGVSKYNFRINSFIQQALAKNISTFSILQLRAAEYLQKWKEIAQSGNQDYKTQIEKFWGVKVPTTLSHLSFNLGGMVSNLNFSEVVNTNLEPADSQAEIKGLGRGTGNGKIYFDNSKFGNKYGIIIITYHNRPLLDYSLNSTDILNKKINVGDFCHPSFDKIGMQQTHLLDMINDANLYRDFKDKPLADLYIGYAPRYAEYKTNVDRIHGGFATSALSHWSAPVTSEYMRQWMSFGNGALVYDYNVFKVNPSILNTIFLNQITEQNEASYDSDQFLINSDIVIKAIRNLDRNGLPY